MPRRPSAKETSAQKLKREIEIAEERCRQEEAEISDAETLNSESDPNYQPSEATSDGSYESDFIDDSEAPPMNKWKPYDMRRIEEYRSYLNVLAKKLNDHRDNAADDNGHRKKTRGSRPRGTRGTHPTLFEQR